MSFKSCSPGNLPIPFPNAPASSSLTFIKLGTLRSVPSPFMPFWALTYQGVPASSYLHRASFCICDTGPVASFWTRHFSTLRTMYVSEWMPVT